jgi:hypothetical protein
MPYNNGSMRTIFLSLNALVAFLSELAMLGAYAWWALSLKVALPLRVLIAVVIVAIVVVLWGMFFAPKASVVLAQPWNALGEYTLFSLAGVALFFVAGWQVTLIYIICALASETIGLIWK